MKKSDYKYLTCAVALSLSVGLGGQTALAAVDASAAPQGVGVDLNSGASTAMNTSTLARGSVQLPDESSADAAGEQTPTSSRDAVWQDSRPSEEEIVGSMQAFEGKTIVDVKYEGVSDDIMSTIRLAQVSKPGDACSVRLLSEDARSIYATGYFYDIYPTFETVPEGVIVTYHLFETPVISAIELEGNTDIEPTSKLLDKMQLRKGDRLNRLALKEDVRALQKQYIKDGYVMAKIHDMEVGDDGKLVIRINEGILEGFKIKGLKKTKEKVVLRELRPKVGKPLNKNDVVRSYQRLTNLDFFESVDVKPIAGVEPNACVLEVDVTEKNTGIFGIGAGYSNADGFVGMINLGDRNFRGTGDSINVTLTKSSTDTSAKGYIFSYRRPWLDRKETAGNIKIYNRTFEYNEYDTNGDLTEEFMRKNVGFELGLSRPQSEYTTNYITFRNKDDKYEKHKSATDRSSWESWKKDNFGLTRSLLFQHVTDTRDNYIYPTSGYKSTLGYEYAGLGGDFRYHKFTVDGSVFRKVGRNQVLVFHGSYGHATSDLPSVSKFMLGGQDTIRGYRDDMFRGNSMVLGNIEYRFPLSNKFKAAIFTDFGSAWDEGWRPSKLHGSYGVGVMLDSPLGLIRVDIGHGTQGNRVHFNVGGTF
ncbi:MAG: BamA/TamA family outer membrane protein [Anaerovibrio sp.]|nr:BamA/TamA family outer membrane protein [Anaerovibrio sp.]